MRLVSRYSFSHLPKFDASKNYYSVFGLANTATQQEIKAKYYEMAKMYHPDVNSKDDRMFKTINEAYQVLGDADTKKVYDNARNPETRTTHRSTTDYNYGSQAYTRRQNEYQAYQDFVNKQNQRYNYQSRQQEETEEPREPRNRNTSSIGSQASFVMFMAYGLTAYILIDLLIMPFPIEMYQFMTQRQGRHSSQRSPKSIISTDSVTCKNRMEGSNGLMTEPITLINKTEGCSRKVPNQIFVKIECMINLDFNLSTQLTIKPKRIGLAFTLFEYQLVNQQYESSSQRLPALHQFCANQQAQANQQNFFTQQYQLNPSLVTSQTKLVNTKQPHYYDVNRQLFTSGTQPKQIKSPSLVEVCCQRDYFKQYQYKVKTNPPEPSLRKVITPTQQLKTVKQQCFNSSQNAQAFLIKKKTERANELYSVQEKSTSEKHPIRSNQYLMPSSKLMDQSLQKEHSEAPSRQELESKERMIEGLREQHHQCLQQLEEKNQSLITANEKLRNQAKELDIYKEQYNAMQTEIVQLKQDNKNKDQNPTLAIINDWDKLKQKLIDQQGVIDNLTNENNNWVMNNKRLQNQNTDQQGQIEELKKEMANLSQMIDKQKDRSEIQKLETSLRTAQLENDQKKLDLSKKDITIASLEHRIDQANEANSELQTQLEERLAKIEELASNFKLYEELMFEKNKYYDSYKQGVLNKDIEIENLKKKLLELPKQDLVDRLKNENFELKVVGEFQKQHFYKQELHIHQLREQMIISQELAHSLGQKVQFVFHINKEHQSQFLIEQLKYRVKELEEQSKPITMQQQVVEIVKGLSEENQKELYEAKNRFYLSQLNDWRSKYNHLFRLNEEIRKELFKLQHDLSVPHEANHAPTSQTNQPTQQNQEQKQQEQKVPEKYKHVSKKIQQIHEMLLDAGVYGGKPVPKKDMFNETEQVEMLEVLIYNTKYQMMFNRNSLPKKTHRSTTKGSMDKATF